MHDAVIRINIQALPSLPRSAATPGPLSTSIEPLFKADSVPGQTPGLADASATALALGARCLLRLSSQELGLKCAMTHWMAAP